MKRTLISALVMALLVCNTIGVQAATTDGTNTNNASVTTNTNTTKISLDNIKEIMTENNLAIKILYDKMKIANETYHNALDDYKNNETDYDVDDGKPDSDDYITDEYSDGKSNPEYIADLKYYEDYETYESVLDDYKTVRDAYETGIEDQVNSARDAYIIYLSDISSRELQESKVKIKERDALTAKLKYDQGFLSKIEYNKSVQNITTETNSLSKLKDTEELAKLKLCNTLGVSDVENVEFSTDIGEYLAKVSQINYDDDSAKMLENNYDIRKANNDIDDLKDEEDTYDDNNQEDIYDYKMESAEATLKEAINTANSDFKSQYSTLMNSYNTMKNNNNNLDLEKTDYNTAQLQYNYGFISKNDLEDAKIGTSGLDSVNSDYENAKIEFYKNYLRYLQMKEGY